MRLIAGLILLIVTMLIECVPRIDLPSGSSGEF
uniref:Lipoprotein n=1 Tax=Heterorhabditis bacteriophora TaxID=37862 RepID=A0A1I7WU34_HETBA